MQHKGVPVSILAFIFSEGDTSTGSNSSDDGRESSQNEPAMTELSFGARLLLSLLLTAVSLFVWKWLQPATAQTQPTAKRSKKKSKKKSKKADKSPQKAPKETNSNVTVANPPSDESDSDDGRSAAQVLSTKTFKPKNLGGNRLAKKIKAALPGADVVRFSVGQEVLGRFGGGDQWFPATVLELRKGNEYHLKYDDGEVEHQVPAALIKVRPTPKSDDESGDEEAKGIVPEPVVAQEREKLALKSDSSESDDGGWQVVENSSVTKRLARRVKEQTQTEPVVAGLTKRQRENRRKKERQREMREMLRQQAQKDDTDARARWRYVPSGSPPS